jgi:hypothetical protein
MVVNLDDVHCAFADKKPPALAPAEFDLPCFRAGELNTYPSGPDHTLL